MKLYLHKKFSFLEFFLE